MDKREEFSGALGELESLIRPQILSTVQLFAQIGLFTHFIVRLSPEFGSGGAAAALSLTAICAVIGRTLLGWFIGDRDRRLAASASFLVQAVGVLLLTVGSGVALLALGCVLFGL